MLCARWQRETGERISLILQAGDLGAYPDLARLDRATIRHAQRDENEVGFQRDFVEKREDVTRRLAETTCPMIFVRGNHEDHAWLDDLERRATAPIFPVDVYERIFCLQTGAPYTFAEDGSTLAILGVGRIGAPVGADSPPAARYAQPSELERLYALGAVEPDILLTHDVPPTHHNSRSAGMEEIRLLLDEYRPIYHFYGHTEEPYLRDLDRNGITTAIRLTDLNWDHKVRGAPLHADAMGILRWRDRANHSFSVVDAPWLREYSLHDWFYC